MKKQDLEKKCYRTLPKHSIKVIVGSKETSKNPNAEIFLIQTDCEIYTK